MAKTKSNLLTDNEIKKAEPKESDYKISEGNGFYLLVKQNGTKVFRFDFTFNGKRGTLTIGKYPIVTIKEARAKHLEAQKQIQEGINPSRAKVEVKEAKRAVEELKELEAKTQLHLVAYAWLESVRDNIKEVTQKKRHLIITRHLLLPYAKVNENGFIISTPPIHTITRKNLLATLQSIDNKGLGETARKIAGFAKRIFDYAVNKEYIEINPMYSIIQRDIFKKREVRHHPALTDETELKALFDAIDNYKGYVIVRQALKLVTHIPLRASKLASLRWEFVDFENRLLTIPRSQMKVSNSNLDDFRLPLTVQSLKVLQDTKQLGLSDEWVFPSDENFDLHINPETPRAALNDMGYQGRQSLHGFRTTIRSLCDTHYEEHNTDFRVLESVLDHIETNKVVRAYTHKADYTKRQRVLLEWWGSFVDKIKE